MLIALAGFSGAGKTTAIAYLTSMGFGEPYYAGSIVHAELSRRQLAVTPESERNIRAELRQTFGMGVFAERAAPELRRLCVSSPVLLDAVYCPDELELYKADFGEQLVTVAIEAAFNVRAPRVAAREERPIPFEKLRLRDKFEVTMLRLDEVIAAADLRIANEHSLDEFQKSLNGFAASFA